MGTKKPSSVVTSMGQCMPGMDPEECCMARSGRHEVDGHFGEVFMDYARANYWMETDADITFNDSDVTWEDFYYNDDYKYELSYDVNNFSSMTIEIPGDEPETLNSANGPLNITLRCEATVHSTPSNLTDAAPELFTEVTDERIDQAFPDWQTAVTSHWTGKYTVQIGAPDCPGEFPMSFFVERAGEDTYVHTDFTVLDMIHPRDDTGWAAILADPTHAQNATARELSVEWRSNAGKFNLGDNRGTLVFAHEYGHWMGWGDEYIEITGRDKTHPDDATKTVLYENRGGTEKSLRVAVRIKNPTKTYSDDNGTDIEVVDIAVAARNNWLMADMQPSQTHPKRSVYTIVRDFVRLYNGDHYGGGNTAWCIDVL